MQSVCAKIVPKIFTFVQQEARTYVRTYTLNAIIFRILPRATFLAVKSASTGTKYESVEAMKGKAASILKEMTKERLPTLFQIMKDSHRELSR